MKPLYPPRLGYQTPVVVIISIAIDGSLCQSNIKDYPINQIIEESDEE